MSAEQTSSTHPSQDQELAQDGGPAEEASHEAGQANSEVGGEKLAEALARADEFKDQYMRALAELDNVRKRSAREVERAHKYGIERFASELLAVADSLEMGIQAAGQDAPEAVAEGGRATLKLMLSTLEKFGISQVCPEGAPFDPEWHEAMATQPSDNMEPNTVLQVVQKGYRIHDRLLRPARVIVSREPEQA